MKPGIINIPDSADTIALLNRDIFQSDTTKFEYYNGLKIVKDSQIKYHNLANACVRTLEKTLKNDGYFVKVYNLHDSLNYLWKNDRINARPKELFKDSRSDLCVFLDYFNFYRTRISTHSDFNTTSARLIWTIVFRDDTISYYYNQKDTLGYDYFQTSSIMKYDDPEPLLKNAAEYLGQSFASKLIPSWMPVERMYYKSGNIEMLKAEKLALHNDWLKAAEIWNRMTTNKNDVMAAKAKFNMALACEIEGKPDLAIEWLIRSYNGLKKENMEHRLNCQRYVNVLAMRKKDIVRLGKQMRNPANAESNQNQNQEPAESE